MEQAASMVVDKFKGIAKSSQDFVDGLIHRRDNSSRRHPIEILKRLQREAFSDLMKLRDRQDKVERMLSFYGTSKGGPFREAGTTVRGEFDAAGALVFMNSADQLSCEAFNGAGIRTGINARLIFETNIRKSDSLVAEFVAGQDGKGYLSDNLDSSLSLAKVSYLANVNDWFSVAAVPIGAQCKDIAIHSSSSHQVKGRTGFSSSGPPLWNQQNGSAIGLAVSKSNVAASFGQLVSALRVQPSFDVIGHCLSTFGQVVCQLPKGIKLSISGVHQLPKIVGQRGNLGALTIPVGFLSRKSPETLVAQSSPSMEISSLGDVSIGSVALMLESELDESTKIQGYIEMKKSDTRNLQWAISVSDDSDDDKFGWGLTFSGTTERPHWDHYQVESYVKLNLSKKFSLQPGIVYVMNGPARIPAFIVRSRWSL